MKIFDWFFYIFYCFTLDRGSRLERANFLLWFSSSFFYVAIFYLILILINLQIHKVLFLPIFVAIFIINFLILKSVYLNNRRSKMVIQDRGEGTKSIVLFSRFFSISFTFFTMALMIMTIIYYGKFISFL